MAKNSLKNSFRFVYCVSYYVIMAGKKMCPIIKRTVTETTKPWRQKQKRKTDRQVIQTFQKKGKESKLNEKKKSNSRMASTPIFLFYFKDQLGQFTYNNSPNALYTDHIMNTRECDDQHRCKSCKSRLCK